MRNHFRIIIFLLVLSGAGILYSSKLNEVLDGELYTPSISIVAKDLQGNRISTLYLRDFVFFYDFTKKKGNISFEITRNLIFEKIAIEFPSVIKNNSWYIHREQKEIRKKIWGLSWKLIDRMDVFRGSKNTKLVLREITGVEYDKIIINFESDFKPKGRFNFIIHDNSRLYADQDKGNINFILGSDYQCVYPCIYKEENVKETYRSFDKDIRLEWQIDKNNPNNLFYINAISRKILFWKGVISSLSIALLISLLIKLIPFPSKK